MKFVEFDFSLLGKQRALVTHEGEDFVVLTRAGGAKDIVLKRDPRLRVFKTDRRRLWQRELERFA
tara:strand:- start:4240 stop:4434 length:195 start_codon:yes stop_codon:yes gene_type:complete